MVSGKVNCSLLPVLLGGLLFACFGADCIAIDISDALSGMERNVASHVTGFFVGLAFRVCCECNHQCRFFKSACEMVHIRHYGDFFRMLSLGTGYI